MLGNQDQSQLPTVYWQGRKRCYWVQMLDSLELAGDDMKNHI